MGVFTWWRKAREQAPKPAPPSDWDARDAAWWRNEAKESLQFARDAIAHAEQTLASSRKWLDEWKTEKAQMLATEQALRAELEASEAKLREVLKVCDMADAQVARENAFPFPDRKRLASDLAAHVRGIRFAAEGR